MQDNSRAARQRSVSREELRQLESELQAKQVYLEERKKTSVVLQAGMQQRLREVEQERERLASELAEVKQTVQAKDAAADQTVSGLEAALQQEREMRLLAEEAQHELLAVRQDLERQLEAAATATTSPREQEEEETAACKSPRAASSSATPRHRNHSRRGPIEGYYRNRSPRKPEKAGAEEKTEQDEVAEAAAAAPDVEEAAAGRESPEVAGVEVEDELEPIDRKASELYEEELQRIRIAREEAKAQISVLRDILASRARKLSADAVMEHDAKDGSQHEIARRRAATSPRQRRLEGGTELASSSRSSSSGPPGPARQDKARAMVPKLALGSDKGPEKCQQKDRPRQRIREALNRGALTERATTRDSPQARLPHTLQLREQLFGWMQVFTPRTRSGSDASGVATTATEKSVDAEPLLPPKAKATFHGATPVHTPRRERREPLEEPPPLDIAALADRKQREGNSMFCGCWTREANW
eukprot:TRINITY_DN5081_c0_g1_i3.p1 TRINITY_DN5081_c0_g1~~TRINITY_DN5081_c0_g1_i3.p1  ORF type:complete len:474 (-),score=152.04 TRINITY_DN5081_c0_g1_i3:266-1687(-)